MDHRLAAFGAGAAARLTSVVHGVAAAFAHFYLRDSQPTAAAATDAPAATLAPALPFWQSAAILLTIPSYLIVLAEAMIIAVGTWIFLNWLPLFFKETYNLSLTGAGFAGTFMLQGAATLGLIAGGYLSDWFAGQQPRRRMLMQTVSYGLAAPFLLVFLVEPRLALLNVCIFCFSFFQRLGACNETPLLCDLLAPQFRSTAIGMMNAANCLAGGVGIMLAGYLKATYGLAGIFSGISGLMAAGALLTAAGYWRFLGRDLARRKTWTTPDATAPIPAQAAQAH